MKKNTYKTNTKAIKIDKGQNHQKETTWVEERRTDLHTLVLAPTDEKINEQRQTNTPENIILPSAIDVEGLTILNQKISCLPILCVQNSLIDWSYYVLI